MPEPSPSHLERAVPPVSEPRGTAPDGVAAGDGDSAAKARPRRTRRRSPGRRDHVAPWLAVLACLVLAAIPMLVDLGRPDVTGDAEAQALTTSVETWRDLAQLEGDGLNPLLPTPRYNGEPRFDQPPGLTWLHLIAFSPLDAADASLDDLIFQARLISVAAGLLAVAAVFWAGLSIGGLATALLAGLVCAGLPWLILASRQATAATPQTACAMLAIAAALWAARPLKPPAAIARQAGGWILCGLALGATVLIGGTAPVAAILIPLALVLGICPRRFAYLFALAAAAFIAALMVTPWALIVHEQSPGAWQAWFGVPGFGDGGGLDTAAGGDFSGGSGGDSGGGFAALGEHLAWLMLGTLPWTVWLVGGLVQPFSTSSEGSRSRMFIGWLWFLSLAVMVLLPPLSGGAAEALLLAPASAFLIGQVFRQYRDLSDEGRHARFWVVGRYVHLVMILALSVVLPVALARQNNLVRDGYFGQPLVHPMGWLYWTGMSVSLLMLAGLSVRFALSHHPGRALASWAVWASLAVALTVLPLARGPLSHSPTRVEAAAVSRIVGDERLVYAPQTTGEPREPDPVFLLYSGRAIPTLTPAQADELAADDDAELFLLSGRTPDGPNWRLVDVLESVDQRLWRAGGASSADALLSRMEEQDQGE